jgi:predicted lipoprotein with Yx(FWY)xxD motif
MRKMLFQVLAAATVVGLTVTAGAAATPSSSSAKRRTVVVRISTRKVPKLGTILVNAKGLTLYMFVPDKRRRVTCVSTCAAVWPPVKLPKHATPRAAKKVKQRLLGSDRDPAGGRVVTYRGWPLYTYVSDRKPGQATGQALDLNGGLWYVLAPSGKGIKKEVAR